MIADIGIGEWFLLIVRWVHGVSAVAWIGGSIFFALVLRPVSLANPDAMRSVMGTIGSRYRELVDASILALIVSGIIMMIERVSNQDTTVAWFIVLGVKLALATWMFYLVWQLRRTGYRPEARAGFINRLSWLLGYNAIVAMGVIVFLLANLLRLLFEQAAIG